MMITGRPFTASTNKLAYAQAFSGSHGRRQFEHRSLRSILAARRSRVRSV